MINKIKSLTYAFALGILTLPVIAFAAEGEAEDVGSEASLTITGAGNLPQGSIYAIVGNLMKWILGIVGFVAIIGFCIAGILYLTSAGDEDRQKSAKSAMVYSIIGVVVALGGYVIWGAVQGMLGGTTTDTAF